MPYARVKNELLIIPGYASGDIVTVDAAVAPLNKCIVEINPVQSGTGDPSPSNIRPISGWSSVNVTVNDGQTPPVTENVYTIPLGSTYYGGSLNVTTGVLTVDRAFSKIKDLSWTYQNSYTRFYSASIKTFVKPPESTSVIEEGFMCECYNPHTYNSTNSGDIYLDGIGNLFAKDSNYTDTTNWINAIGDYIVVYSLATPTTVQLTPTEVNTLLGANNIFADTGDVDIIYIRRSGT